MDLLSMDYYLGVKAFHIIVFTSWMAMLFYMPRLFVYNAENIENIGFVDVVKIQQRKLLFQIGNLAMVLTLVSGIWLIFILQSNMEGWMASNGWLHIKLLLLVFLIIYHFSCWYYMREFANNRCKRSGKFFRIFNEIPTIIFIFVVCLAVIKP